LTVKDERIESDNGVVIVGYTDFPSRMATQSSNLYSNNVRHMLTDLTPEKDGVINHDMEDDVIRGATAPKRKKPKKRRISKRRRASKWVFWPAAVFWCCWWALWPPQAS